jgi:Family of unknown function (DUF6221)
MDGLVRFLLDRISEDERVWRRRAKTAHNGGEAVRWLAECATKREIVGIMQRMIILRDQPMERQVRDGAEEVLRRLAAVYQDHAGYRAQWRPKSGRVLT